MKFKIKARLRALFPGVNLSKERLDAIADKLKITEESEIDQALEDANELMDFAAMAKQDDRLRTLEARQKTPATDPDPTPDPNPEQTPKPTKTEGTPDIAKLIQDALGPVLSELSGLKAGKTLDSRRQILETKLKDAQPKFKEKILKDFARMNFEKDDDFDTYVTETEADLVEFNQSLADQGLSQGSKPAQPGGAGTPQAQAKSDIEKWSKAHAPVEAAK